MALAQLQTFTEEDYYNMPEDVRAELIIAQFYYMAATSRIHREILSFVFKKIAYYIDSKNGSCRVYPAPFAVKLFESDYGTIVEPDISVICDPGKLTDRGCTGAPDWIVEIISPGTASHDYVRKLKLYLDAGVKEYWIVDPSKKTVYAYHLEEAKFEVTSYTFRDKIKANLYDDLWIDFEELRP